MPVKRVGYILVLLTFILVACGRSSSAVPTPDLSLDNIPDINWAEEFEAEIEWTECPFDSYGRSPKCGYLSVPVDYTDLKGDKLKIAFAVYETSNTDPAEDPLVMTVGIPLTSQSGFLPYLFQDLYKDRDMVIFDPRGMGLSEPQLICTEIDNEFWDALSTGGLSPEALGDLHTRCRERLELSQVDLNAYTIANSANDVKALRLALEYPKWNLIAVEPYGAAMAYEQLRIDPEGVRSLLLDSVVPGFTDEVPDYASANSILGEFFSLCEADEKCNATFPNIESMFYKVVDKLDSQPINITANDSTAGRRLDVQVDGVFFTELVLNLISGGNIEMMGHAPRMIYQVNDGVYDTLITITGQNYSGTDFSFDGLYALASCRQSPLPDENDVAVALSSLPGGVAGYFKEQDQINRELCAAWGPTPDKPIQTGATSSTTPILLINGSWNWMWAPQGRVDEFQKQMPDLQVASIPMASRFNLFTRGLADCTNQMLIDFITDPNKSVDTSCLPEAPDIIWITMR